ncbi:MAG: glycosyltransferase family 1 protein [Candidatus Buchananbacteria bacterium]
MKILIDARLYGTKHAGIGRYTQELIKNLEVADTQNKYVILLQRQNYDEYRPRNPNFKKYRADFRVYGFFEQILLPFLIYSHRPDLVHFTHFNVPLFFFGRYLVTIHDLIVSHYPSSRATTRHPLLYKFKLMAYRLVVSRAARRAQKIIAVSRYAQKDIARLLKIKPEKISVIYESADLPRESAIDQAELLKRLNVTGDYLLYVGSAYPHKNLEKLIEAFPIVLKQYPDLKLVLAGKKTFFYQRLGEGIKEEFRNKIILTGYLTDQELAGLYAKAKLYVFPSLMEGFGLPPLEAQSYGLPVVSADSSCLPEILGDSAVYFNPEDVKDMAEKIISVLADSNWQRQLADKGRENIKRFSWRKAAEETVELYNSIIK